MVKASQELRPAPGRDEFLRRTGLVGLVLAGFLVAAIVTEQAGPDSSASAATIASQFASARTSVLVSGVLFVVAMAFALWFVIALPSLAYRPGDVNLPFFVASASGLLTVALMTVYASGFAAIGASSSELGNDQHAVYLVFRVLSATDDASGIFIALFIGASGYSLVCARVMARWLAWFGFAAAAARAVGALDVTTLGGLPFAPFMVVGTGLCVVWLVLTSLVLCRARA